jgi:hypothetical protein
MLEEFLKALAGSRTSVIAPIDPPVLEKLRRLNQESFLTILNTQAALSQHTFNFVREMDLETFYQQGEKQIDAIKQRFMSTDRSMALQKEHVRLTAERRSIMRDYLILNGFGLHDGIEFDLRDGVLTKEVEA